MHIWKLSAFIIQLALQAMFETVAVFCFIKYFSFWDLQGLLCSYIFPYSSGEDNSNGSDIDRKMFHLLKIIWHNSY